MFSVQSIYPTLANAIWRSDSGVLRSIVLAIAGTALLAISARIQVNFYPVPMTTMNAWLTIGQEDAKAVAFFREQGNEIIELDAEVQYAAREAGLAWAEGKASENEWFKRVLDHQKAFGALWSGANKYRTVRVRGE